VGVVTSTFLSDALSAAQDAAMPTVRLVAVPAKNYYTARTQEPLMKDVAAAIFDKVLDALKRPLTPEETGGAEASKKAKKDEEILKFTGATYNEAAEALYKGFLERHWADGLPIMPPTKEAVDWMLTGTSRSPDEVIGIVATKGGKATIRKIAANAVMAGARPEYLPVIIAAMEATTGEGLSALHLQASAGCVSPLIMVNGPIAEELGINSGAAYMGYGFRANNSIGRAVRLSMINCGHMWPQQNDMCLLGRQDSFGNTTFAENEQESPWKPYHVDLGFKPEDSTVTVVNYMHHKRGPGGPVVPATPYESLHDLAKTIEIVNTPLGSASNEVVIAIDPTFAHQLSTVGFSKEDIKWWLFLNARTPYSELRKEEKENLQKSIESGKTPAYLWTWGEQGQEKKIENIADVPCLQKPERIHIAVVGGSPGYSYVWESPTGQATKLIRGAALTKAGR
jgi:hypothetical protein